ncbi:hypothetical protein [Dokdonia pacifica]|uniref:Uncharacterized protein n=1 Tax=Dokdonia pacifica TaxID=1627892 RepID=A0A238YHI5_9FLAO|nr:hypothetical protein [Dokdonia pacifica]SNR70655.1 hypothetical protein SAMN06265376_10280 [Dokdonia pacifica]
MLKNILNVEGVQELDKKQQTTINGGILIYCNSDSDCYFGLSCGPRGYCC